MLQAGRKFTLVEGRGEAEDVGIAEQVGAHACAHGIAVDAHDARESAAIRIKGGRAVVCLDLDAGVPVSVEGDDAGVVRKHGLAEVLAAELAADLGRGVTDAGLVEIVDLFRHARFGVFVMDAGGKNLVLAVLGPRLGHDFHFKIRGI